MSLRRKVLPPSEPKFLWSCSIFLDSRTLFVHTYTWFVRPETPCCHSCVLCPVYVVVRTQVTSSAIYNSLPQEKVEKECMHVSCSYIIEIDIHFARFVFPIIGQFVCENRCRCCPARCVCVSMCAWVCSRFCFLSCACICCHIYLSHIWHSCSNYYAAFSAQYDTTIYSYYSSSLYARNASHSRMCFIPLLPAVFMPCFTWCLFPFVRFCVSEQCFLICALWSRPPSATFKFCASIKGKPWA